MTELLWITAIAAAAAGGFMGAFGFWLVTKIERRPVVSIDWPFARETKG